MKTKIILIIIISFNMIYASCDSDTDSNQTEPEKCTENDPPVILLEGEELFKDYSFLYYGLEYCSLLFVNKLYTINSFEELVIFLKSFAFNGISINCQWQIDEFKKKSIFSKYTLVYDGMILSSACNAMDEDWLYAVIKNSIKKEVKFYYYIWEIAGCTSAHSIPSRWILIENPNKDYNIDYQITKCYISSKYR